MRAAPGDGEARRRARRDRACERHAPTEVVHDERAVGDGERPDGAQPSAAALSIRPKVHTTLHDGAHIPAARTF